ncbi:cytochrome P450 [Caulobacter flavus]|uniref:Cytochrome P450 n=1 Tax=Caulobacter flavus TaxID=1679497 RepID=A0A2N5CMT6_9CAUL|nr:cytochrome P450 [Caulobacter flavus]AYV47042.1 cytochrome P450 [Caulobacter flavus]PLR07441.1 cytochrome P450 [Caulobacter flavus]
MELISKTVVDGRPGPGAAKAYPTLDGVDLADIFRFTQGQPFADFARMRQEAPVMWHGERFGGPGFWAVTRYEDVMRVNGDPETFSSQKGGILMSMGPPDKRHALLFRATMDTMINLDAPHHLQLRREHMPYFTASYLRGLTDKVKGEVTRLLDEMEPLLAGGAEIDMVEHFSSILPLFTLCEILGVPPEDRSKFLRWMHYLERAQDLAVQQAMAPITPTLELMQFVADFNENVEEMFDYGRTMLLKRREDPRQDLMTAIARAQVDGDLLADEYLDGSWLLIVFAGNDTTRNTLSGAMRLLTEFPEQKQRLIDDPSLLPGAVDEFIRMVSPVIYMRRTATRDVEVAGQKIAEGEKVVMYYGAANRDPAMFENPDRLDVTRPNAGKHVAFGYGPHTCLGKRVAQIQLEEAYRQILARFPDLEWTGSTEIAANNFVHAISKLGVRRAV